MKTYSYSSLAVYRQCPRRHFYRHVAKTKPIVIPQSVELFLGLRLHETMKFLYRRHADGLMPSVDEVVGQFSVRWAELWTDRIDLGSKGHTRESIMALGERAVREYYARRQPFTDDRTIGLEQPVSLWIDEEGEYRVIGRLDRLSIDDDGFIITDYMSGARLPTVQDLERDGQLWLYALVVRQGLPPDQPVRLRWEFLRFDGEYTLTPNEEELDDVRRRTHTLISLIEFAGTDPEAFPIRTSPLCSSCQFQHVCPARRHLYEVRVKPECEPTMKDAAGLVDRWVDAEAERKAAAAALKTIEGRIDQIKDSLKLVAEQEGLAKFFGNKGEVGVTVKDDWVPPRKMHEPEKAAGLEAALRASEWWPEVSAMNRHALTRLFVPGSESSADLRFLVMEWAAQVREIRVRLKAGKQPNS